MINMIIFMRGSIINLHEDCLLNNKYIPSEEFYEIISSDMGGELIKLHTDIPYGTKTTFAI